MSKSNISYPYPILDSSDDIEGNFDINATISVNDSVLIINTENTFISNQYFSELLENEILKLVIKAYCSSTMFSKTFENQKIIEISLNTIATNLNLEFLLIANKDIRNYYSETFNIDYLSILNGNGFEIKKGSIMGYGGEMKIPLMNIFTQGLKGIIQFEARDETNPISFDLDGNKIIIYYPKKEDDIDLIGYLGGKGSPRLNTFYNLIILPALSAAFDQLLKKYNENENLEEFIDNHTWAFVITQLFPQFSDCETGYIAAQLLLQLLNNDQLNKLPILKSFDELKNNV
jgi:hypothetical protein